MRGRLKELNAAMFGILEDPRSTRLERLEAGRIIAALYSVLVPSGIGEALLSQKQIVQLRAAREAIAEKLFKKKERKKAQNRRGYIRRRLTELAQTPEQTNGDNNGTEQRSEPTGN